MQSHSDINRRSIALHAAIAQKIAINPDLLSIARVNIDRWSGSGAYSNPYFNRWLDVLSLPLPEILIAITAETEEMIELRQSSPFAGVLTPKERWRIYETFRT
jgi:hypothetical protein